jgi:hypothetical protein
MAAAGSHEHRAGHGSGGSRPRGDAPPRRRSPGDHHRGGALLGGQTPGTLACIPGHSPEICRSRAAGGWTTCSRSRQTERGRLSSGCASRPGLRPPKNFHKVLERLWFIRSLELPANAGEGIHHNRLIQLAREGQKTTPQHLRRFDAAHRQAALVAYLTERAGSLADEALDMHDRLMGEMLGKGEKARDENFRKRGKAINEKVGLYAGVGKALIAARESGEDPYAVIEEFIEWERFVASVGEAEELALPADFDYLDHLRNQYRRLRGYAPALLEAFEFEAAPPAEPVLEALTVLREMNEKGKRKVPDDAPTDFVRRRWQRHVFGEDGGIDKPFYEMGAMNELNNALRSGNVWVPGSRRYADLEELDMPRSSRRCMTYDSTSSAPT